MSTKSTTIRISQETKEEIENLDFVKKDTFNSILKKLIEFYEKNKKR
jgi:predicted DNA-binding protein